MLSFSSVMATELADTFLALALAPQGYYKLFCFVAALLRVNTMVENCHQHSIFSLTQSCLHFLLCHRECYPFALLSLSSKCSLGHDAMHGELQSSWDEASEKLQPNWTESQSEMVLLLVPYSVCSRRGWDTQDGTDTFLETGRIIHEKSPLLLLLPDLKSYSTNN